MRGRLHALISHRKTEAHHPEVGTNEKKKIQTASQEAARSHAQSFEGSHFSVSHPQPSAFAMETVLPPSLAPPFLQCTLENAVYLWLPSRGKSSLHALKGLRVPESCAKTPAVSGEGDVVLTERPRNPPAEPKGVGKAPPNGRPPRRYPGRHWLWRFTEGGVIGMRRGAVRRSRC